MVINKTAWNIQTHTHWATKPLKFRFMRIFLNIWEVCWECDGAGERKRWNESETNFILGLFKFGTNSLCKSFFKKKSEKKKLEKKRKLWTGKSRPFSMTHESRLNVTAKLAGLTKELVCAVHFFVRVFSCSGIERNYFMPRFNFQN